MPAIASHSTATTTAPWDEGPNERRLKAPLSQQVASRFYAWREAGDWPTTKVGYKFGHHVVAGDGTPGAANLTAASTGIGVLNGGRGGTTIPQADRQGVWSHLARHLRDAGREPPPLKAQDEYERLLAEVNSGERQADTAEFDVLEESEMLEQMQGLAPLLPVAGTLWAIRPDVLPRLMEAQRSVEAWDSLLPMAAAVQRRRSLASPRAGGKVAVLSLAGVITPQPSLLSLLLGGNPGGLEGFRSDFRDAMAASDVSAIVLDIDSPGGLISQVPETAAEIHAARGQKPIIAVANTLAASAAYWIAAQADEVVATPSGEAGSIGVYAVHTDRSGMNDRMGVAPTYISAGKYKVEGNPDEALSEEARERWQQDVEDLYAMFVESVAAGRGVAASRVAEGYGEGRSLLAQRALNAGLVDRVATLPEVVGGIAGGQAGGARGRAVEDRRRRAALMF